MRFLRQFCVGACAALTAFEAAAQEIVPDPEFEEILALDIADLTVTSASKRAQRLSDVPSAIYVLTQEDIRRSGATSIPEALRMVPGLQVARVASNQWAVSSRGFNNALSNKLLVMIDGRSIYTPVFSGTYWDDQTTLLHNIERIEVIRGPGASIWGANAVNGIINIITKSAADSQGDYLATGFGSEENFIEGQRGAKTADNRFYRAYASYHRYDDSVNLSNADNHDDWYRGRSGFRVEKQKPDGDQYFLQGDVYGGRQDARSVLPTATAPFSETLITNNTSYGGNIIGRWDRRLSSRSDISLQGYLDHYVRLESITDQHVSTANIDFQHNWRLTDRHNFIWGAGARIHAEDLKNTFAAMFNQEFDTHETISAFAQDEYALVPDSLYLTLGSKFEHNSFTDFEVQPSGRLAWHPTDNQTVWGAVSRAVRIPSSIEEDVSIAVATFAGAPPNTWRLIGNPNQETEKLIAYELGHRIQPTPDLSFDTTVFFNDYSDLVTANVAGPDFLDPNTGTLVTPFTLSNLGSGHAYGGEIAANWNATDKWRLMGSYSFLKLNLDVKPGAAANLNGTERLAPRNQFSIRSYYNVTENVHWDNMFYYVASISEPADSYLRYDTRIAWQTLPGMELSLIGRNLLDPHHAEFPSTSNQAQVDRSVLAQVSLRF